jgi:hypothetical protein
MILAVCLLHKCSEPLRCFLEHHKAQTGGA